MSNLADKLREIDDFADEAQPPEPAPRTAIVQSVGTIEPREIDWLVRNYLPAAMLTLFAGYAGDGKSTICTYLAAKFSTGGTLWDGTPAPVLNSLFLSGEEDPQYALRPRLDLHGADLSRVFLMRGTQGADGKLRWSNLATDLPQLRAVIEQNHIDVVFIDPLTSYLPGTDRNAEGDMRDALSGLQALMEETGVAVVGIAHIGKSDGKGRRIEQRIMGSTAFVALARTVWMLNELPDEHQPDSEPGNPQPRRKVFGVAKANYSMKPPSYQLVRPLDGPLQWLGQSPVSIAESFEASSDMNVKASRCDEWLTEYLGTGSKAFADITASASGRYSDKMIRASLLRIGAGKYQVKGAKHGGWFWKLNDAPVSLSPTVGEGEEGESDKRDTPASLSHGGQEIKRPEHLENSPMDDVPADGAVSDGHPITFPFPLYRQEGKVIPDTLMLPIGTADLTNVEEL